MRLRSWMIVLAVALSAGCGSSEGTPDGVVGGPDTGGGPGGTVEPIELPAFTPPEKDTILGQVVNVDGLPVEGVAVSAGGATATTNYDGLYFLADVAPAERIVVRFQHPGYSDSTRTATMFDDGRIVANAVLVRREAPARVDPALGADVAVPGGKVVLPAGAIVDSTGAAAVGEVRLQVTPIPIDGATIEAAPGDFSSRNGAGEDGQLETFAMAEYRLLDEAGNPLQIKEGEKATIEMMLPADTTLTAGETVPAWHFDEAEGRWVEEGTGTVEISSEDPTRLAFVAEVGHFSTWNCDKEMETTCLTGRVLLCDGTPAAGADLLGAGVDYDGTSRGFGGGDGTFCMNVRKGSTVSLAAAHGYGADRLVAVTTVTTQDTTAQCPGPCQQVDITLPCTPQEAAVDCDDTFFAGCKACVSGKVVDSSGSPVAAVVKVTTGRTTLTAVTNERGEYCAPAALDALATIVATARGGEGGMTTVTPTTAGACPACTTAADIVVDVSASGSEDDLDFSACSSSVGGMTIDRVTVDGGAPALGALDAGWLLATRVDNEGSNTVWSLSFQFVDSAAEGVMGVPVANVHLRLEAAPSGATTYTLTTLPDDASLTGNVLSSVGSMTGLANETYDLDDQGPLAVAEIELESGFSAVGDAVRGRYRFTFGPDCAPERASLTVTGTIDTTLRDQTGLFPTSYDPESPEYGLWMCGLYDLYVWAKSIASLWEGAVQVFVDGVPVITEDAPLATARYSWMSDQLSVNFYGGDTNFSATVDQPVSGPNAVTGGSLMFNGSDCYFEVASGSVVVEGFAPGGGDAWFTGSFDVDFTKSSFSEGTCPDRTVTGQFGAAVCR